MSTRVVNMHVAGDWDVNIARPSKWGNPFSHLPGTRAKYKVETREEAVMNYAQWIKKQPGLMADLHELKDKTLGCWCHPRPCHGHVLAKLADELPDEVLIQFEPAVELEWELGLHTELVFLPENWILTEDSE